MPSILRLFALQTTVFWFPGICNIVLRAQCLAFCYSPPWGRGVPSFDQSVFLYMDKSWSILAIVSPQRWWWRNKSPFLIGLITQTLWSPWWPQQYDALFLETEAEFFDYCIWLYFEKAGRMHLQGKPSYFISEIDVELSKCIYRLRQCLDACDWCSLSFTCQTPHFWFPNSPLKTAEEIDFKFVPCRDYSPATNPVKALQHKILIQSYNTWSCDVGSALASWLEVDWSREAHRISKEDLYVRVVVAIISFGNFEYFVRACGPRSYSCRPYLRLLSGTIAKAFWVL